MVEFTLLSGEPLPENIFNQTEDSLTILKQPYQAETRGGYIVIPTVYLADWPRGAVTIDEDESIYWTFVKIMDPCIDLDIRKRPTLCLTQNHISGSIPDWMR